MVDPGEKAKKKMYKDLKRLGRLCCVPSISSVGGDQEAFYRSTDLPIYRASVPPRSRGGQDGSASPPTRTTAPPMPPPSARSLRADARRKRASSTATHPPQWARGGAARRKRVQAAVDNVLQSADLLSRQGLRSNVSLLLARVC